MVSAVCTKRIRVRIIHGRSASLSGTKGLGGVELLVKSKI